MTRQEAWYWTPQRVVAAIQVFAEIYGRQPSYVDFNPSKAQREQHKRFRDDGCWPSGATVVRHWGTWNAAIEAAGFEPVKPGTNPNPIKDLDRCPNGHEYTPENTRHRKSNGFRICVTCRRESAQRHYNANHKGKGSRASRGMPISDHPKHRVSS